jgi:hypothetical protein
MLALLYPFALADAGWVRLVTNPTGTALAHARAAWLHRWCRVIRGVLGLRLKQHGFTPVSGIVVSHRAGLLDAILLGSVRPYVFVAGAEVRRWPWIGLLARLAGTIFLDPGRRSDLARTHFMMQRAVQRRLLVVVFPPCGDAGASELRGLGSALLQPATELGCTVSAAAIASRPHLQAAIAFSPPSFRPRHRKQLARQLHAEARALERHAMLAAS